MRRRSYLSAIASSPLATILGDVKSEVEDEVVDIHKIHAHHNNQRRGFIEYSTENSFELEEEYTDYYTWKKTAGEMAFRVDPEVAPIADIENTELVELYNFKKSLAHSKFKTKDYIICISSYESKYRIECYKNDNTVIFECRNKESIENGLDNNNVI